jgi:hypothetical protein
MDNEVANPWYDFLISHSDDDLLMVAQKQRLKYVNTPIDLHWLDRVCLLLARQAYKSKKSLIISYPIPICNLPALVATQLVLFNFIQTHVSQQFENQKQAIMLISPRTEVRDHYLGLRISRQPVATALPIARMRTQGEPAIIEVPGEIRSQKPSLYHISRPHLLDSRWPAKLGAIVVDYSGGTFNEYAIRIQELAHQHNIPSVIHITTDPFSPFIEELSHYGVSTWIWDHKGLATEFGAQLLSGNENARHPFSIGHTQFKNIANGIEHRLLLCHHPVFEAASRRLWDDLVTIQQGFSGRHGMGIHRAIRATYGVFYALLQMQIPLPVYEEETHNLWGMRSIHRRIADLEVFGSVLRQEAPEMAEIYWPSLLLDLKEMQTALMAGNPKYDTLVQLVKSYLTERKKLTIVCTNQTSKRMLHLCLRAREGLVVNELTDSVDDCIQLITFKDLNTIESAGTLLFPGQLSLGRRQYALTAASPEILYLAYPDEGERITKQVVSIHQTLNNYTSNLNRQRAWANLSSEHVQNRLPESNHQEADIGIEFTKIEGKTTSRQLVKSATQATDLALWTPFSTSEYDTVQGQDVLGRDDEEALRPSEFASNDRQRALVQAIRIEFVDGFCLAEPNSQMTVLLLSHNKTDDRWIKGLRPEDTVIFVDGDQKRQLYESILERIQNHPAMGTTYILASYWRQAIREGFFRTGLTYESFHRKLKELGSKIETPQAIYFWLQGWVLGPRDEEDIRRIGQVLEDQVLLQEWKAINQAVEKVRGLHLSLARKLNRIIVQAGIMSKEPDSTDECIDRELNLYLDDFRDSVTLHRITSISEEILLVPYVLTGKFFLKGTELKW